ncbi:MAG: ribonuclease R [Bacteroidetes bacterium]|nr:ribonuclease R [Bacteroidota bacterium]
MKKRNNRTRKPNSYDEVLKVLTNEPNKPLNYKQIGSKIPYISYKEVNHVLDMMVRDGKITQPDRGKYMLEQTNVDEVIGTLDFNSRGDAYLVVENVEDDIKIKAGDTLDAFDGDEVAVKLKYTRGKTKPRAFVTRVITRARETYVGTVSAGGNAFFIIPDGNKMHTDFFVPKERINGATDGDKVIFKYRDWPAKAKNPYATVVDVLGRSGENTAEMHAIVAEFGFDTKFDDAVEYAADEFPKEISEKEIAKREDFRKITTFTIDPADAKDFDDALSFQTLPNGNVEIGVHIADVSHYVTPGDTIDNEAVQRATSVYLVDRTIPMLPERLSNGLCSLRPHEESLTFSAIFELDAKGNVQKYRFAKTVIYSDHRFAYEDAQEVIENKAGKYAKELETMNDIALNLRNARYKNGAINFETTEFRFVLDEQGTPTSVIPKVRKDAHKMIEEYMLLANKYVAMHLYTKNDKMPLPYRVHEEPSEEKITEFATTAAEFGFQIDTSSYKAYSNSINEMVAKIEGTLEGDILQPLAIRSMEKAYYTSKKIGHFGLAFEHYAHFTSPIRRYPDLITHRMLQDYLTKRKSFDYGDVEKMASHSSKQEQKATQAERASTKYKQVEYMASFKGEEFDGIISGVTDWGIFVEILENKCEGMVRLRDMKGDHYTFLPEKKKVIGERTKKSYSMGQRVRIRVKNTDLAKRNIDFVFVEERYS